MELLYSSLCNLEEPLKKRISAATVNKQVEYASFLGRKIPNKVEIHPPTDIVSKGQCKRIRKSKEKKEKKQNCSRCKQLVDHDARNCPLNRVA
jgi:hypothetical protein